MKKLQNVILLVAMLLSIISCAEDEFGPLPLGTFANVRFKIVNEADVDLLNPSNPQCLNVKDLKVYLVKQQENGEALLDEVSFNVAASSESSLLNSYLLSTTFLVSKEKPAEDGKAIFVWSDSKRDTISYGFTNNRVGWYYDTTAVRLNGEKMQVEKNCFKYYWR